MRFINKPQKQPIELLSKEVNDSLAEIIKEKSHKKIKSNLYQAIIGFIEILRYMNY